MQTIFDRESAYLLASASKSVEAHEHSRAVAHCAGMASILRGLEAYAEEYEEDIGAPLAEDAYLGAEFLGILRGCVDLLNGPLGGLSGGVCDGTLREIAKKAGFTEEL